MLENDNEDRLKNISHQLALMNKNLFDLNSGLMGQAKRINVLERQIDALKHVTATLESMIIVNKEAKSPFDKFKGVFDEIK